MSEETFLDLLEYEAKREFSKYNIPVPKGIVATDSKSVSETVSALKPPFMVKAQVLSGGRGKAGGIISAESHSEVIEAVSKLLGTRIKELVVKQVLIEEKLSIKKELYLGITIDRFNKSYVLLASSMGGIDIEEIAEKSSKAIIRFIIDPQLGIRSFHALSIAKKLGYNGEQLVELSSIIQKLYRACVEADLELIEINPLTETEKGSFVAADARIVIDDNALFRHPEYEAKIAQKLTPQEEVAFENNLVYVKLDGNIGVVGNGAGLVMATLDLLDLYGGKPANFLDLGGGANISSIKAAIQIVLGDPSVKIVLVNVLGGITRCDEVARGIIEATEDAKIKKPLVVRLVGTNEEEGQRILINSGIKVLDSMEEAARHAVDFAARGRL